MALRSAALLVLLATVAGALGVGLDLSRSRLRSHLLSLRALTVACLVVGTIAFRAGVAEYELRTNAVAVVAETRVACSAFQHELAVAASSYVAIAAHAYL